MALDYMDIYREALMEVRLKVLQDQCRRRGLVVGKNKRDCISGLLSTQNRVSFTVNFINGEINLDFKTWEEDDG